MKLYRAMIVAADGLPELGRSPRTLGVRLADQAPNQDVSAVSPYDVVVAGAGGMSVTPNDPRGLPRHRRPPEHGGTGKDPVWVIDTADLPAGLEFRQDKPTHGMIEPGSAESLVLGEYEGLLASTRERWKLVGPVASGEAP